MGTKENPGDFDCYDNAEPDEPMFILLARDRTAPELVEEWANLRERQNGLAGFNRTDPAKIAEARTCAESMRAWRQRRDDQDLLAGAGPEGP